MPADVKQQITDALLQLLDKKSLEKITVRELAELCGISRQTFYYHFEDVFDVVDWWSRQSAEQMHCGPHGSASNFRRCRARFMAPVPGPVLSEPTLRVGFASRLFLWARLRGIAPQAKNRKTRR